MCFSTLVAKPKYELACPVSRNFPDVNMCFSTLVAKPKYEPAHPISPKSPDDKINPCYDTDNTEKDINTGIMLALSISDAGPSDCPVRTP